MAVYKENLVDINLETGNIHRSFLKHSIGSLDAKADRFGVRVFRDGTPVDLTGVSVQGIFLPPVGSPIAITSGNVVSGNVAAVVLPQACYNYDGQFMLSIKLVGGGVTGTIRIVDGMVENTHASGTVAPTSAVPTYQEILNLYDEMMDAKDAATTAISEVYDGESTYTAGEYCIHDGGVYVCIADITTPEAWTAAHWRLTNIGEGVTDLGEDLSDLSDKVDGIDSDLTTLTGRVDGHDDDIATLDGRVDGHDDDIATLDGRVDGHDDDIATLDGRVDGHDDDLTTVTGRLDGLDDELSDTRHLMAKEYRTSATYRVGDYCVHNGDLYVCVSAIPTAEAWTASHWKAAEICEAVTDTRYRMYDEEETGNIGYLSEKHDKLYINPNNEILEHILLSYTDYILIPENATSITVRGKVTNSSTSTTYALTPDVFVYDEDYNLIPPPYTSTTIEDLRTHSLEIPGAKYVRVNQPSSIAPETKFIRFNYAVISDENLTVLKAAHSGLIASYVVTNTINVYIFGDGLFAAIGKGPAPTYSFASKAPWVTDGCLNMIREIYIDDRITISALTHWFSIFTETSATFYGANRIEKRIDFPKNTTNLGSGVFTAFQPTHINFCTCDNLTTFGSFPPPARNRHTILSIPSRMCTSGFIDQVVTALQASVEIEIRGMSRPYAFSNVVLYITDSADLHDALCSYIYSCHTTVQKNAMCILCNHLGKDGFPDYWNERMKTCITEIMPYIGAQNVMKRIIKGPEADPTSIVYPITGLSSLNTYVGLGWIHPYSVVSVRPNDPEIPPLNWEKVDARLYTYDHFVDYPGPGNPNRNVYKHVNLGELNTYMGQPISTDLGNLTMGMSCSGFVNFIFWRYFNENFGMSSSADFYEMTGEFGQTLAIYGVTEENLRPFDILNMKLEGEDGGHTAIYLGSWTDGNNETHKQVIQCTTGNGIAFGRWGFEGTDEKYWRLRGYNNDFRHHVIAYETIEDDDDDDDDPDVDPEDIDPGDSDPSESDDE